MKLRPGKALTRRDGETALLPIEQLTVGDIVIVRPVIVTLVISALGFSLRLPLGVVGHEGSTVLVCLNGLRLLAFRADGTSNRSNPRI